MPSSYAGERAIAALLKDGIWTAHTGAQGGFYKYDDCVVPRWVMLALAYGAESAAVQKEYLTHRKRFEFVYAAMDYGVSPYILDKWVEDGKFSPKQRMDFRRIIQKYRGNEVKLDRFEESRDCGPWRKPEPVPVYKEPRVPIWEGEEFTPQELHYLFAVERLERAKRQRPAIEAEIAADGALRREMKRRREAKEIVWDERRTKKRSDACATCSTKKRGRDSEDIVWDERPTKNRITSKVMRKKNRVNAGLKNLTLL